LGQCGEPWRITGRLERVTSEDSKRVYARNVEILNTQDLDSLDEVVDPERYKEICVGLTPGLG
jgi:hypothetical protein